MNDDKLISFITSQISNLFPLSWNIFYDSIYLEVLRKKLDNGKIDDLQVEILLSEEETERLVKKMKESLELVVFASFPPPKELENLFIVNRLPNAYGGLTFIEEQYAKTTDNPDLTRLRIVENKLKLKIHKPALTLKDLKGASALKREIEYIAKTIDHPKLRAKGVFLIGIPGTGKSYSAKCCAGELNRWLIEMNLSKILEDEKPIELTFRIFEMLEKLPHPSILWIDEIDKVFTGGEKETKLMGQLLTILNEFNTETGFKADCFFWVTANNVEQIVKRNPEFFRRFDYLFFVQTPKKVEVKEIFKMYFKKYKISPKVEDIEGDEDTQIETIIRIIEMVYQEFLEADFPATSDRFLYTPAEIERLCKKLAVISIATGKDYFKRSEIEQVARMNRPVMESMRDAIKSMLAQKRFFVEV